MSTCDTNGRPWAKLSTLKAGDKVELDHGFDCMKGVREVFATEHGLYVACTEGNHWLAGQADDGEHLVGVYGPITD